MAMLDEVLTIGFESDTEWPEEVKNAQYVNLIGGSPSFDPHTKTITITVVDPGSVAQWRTLVATDFSAQADQVFSADGTYVIDGNIWTVKNSENKITDSPFQIVNGVGLQLPASAIAGYTTFDTNSRTNPRILLPLSPFTRIKNSTPVRAMFELAYLRSNSSGFRTLVGLVFENNTDNARSNSVAHIGGLAAPSSTPTNLYVLSSFARTRTHAAKSVTVNNGVAFLRDSNQLGITMPLGLPSSKPAIWGCATAAQDAYTDMDQLAETTYDGRTIDPAYNEASWEEMQASRWWVSLVSGVEGTAGDINRYPVIKKFHLQAYY